MVLIERLSDKGLNYRLATHVQLGSGMVEFLQHRGCEINVDPLNRLHHLATVGEETRNILPAVRHLGDGLSRNVLLGFTRLHHIVFAHFEDERIQSTLRPSNRAVLFRIVQTLVEIVGMSKDLLRLFDDLDTESYFARDERHEETRVEIRRFPLLATYELALKCSNLFNLLDARGAISVTERVGVIGRIRNLAVGVAKAYALQQTE